MASEPTTGRSLLVVTLTLHSGGGGSANQNTLMLAGALGPTALVPTTVYVRKPVVEEVATQVEPVLVQPVHVYAVALPSHSAVNTMLPPTRGDGSLVKRLHEGGPAGVPGEHIATGIAAGPYPSAM